MKTNFLKLFVSIAVCELAGVVGAVFTTPAIAGWYGRLVKPAQTPPSVMFGPVWTTIFLLLGIALFLVWKNDWQVRNNVFVNGKKAWNKWSEKFWRGEWQKANIVAIFWVQLALNILWSFIFFYQKMPGLAFFELIALWFSILYLIVNFYRISKTAAWLLLPYILWVTYAGYLNFAIWMLNK